jgi:NAD+--asparagine ADP-ribosyltransferase
MEQATQNRINVLKKQIIDAQAKKDANKEASLKKQLVDITTNALKKGEMDPLSITEDGEGGTFASAVGGAQTGINMAGTNTADLAPFAAKLGEKPNYNNPGKYKSKKSKIMKRKTVYESVKNYIDNLFEGV